MAKTVKIWNGTDWVDLGVKAALPPDYVDTTAARTLTLPASPAVGNEIQVFDASGLAGTNNITINSNSGKINGAVQDLILDANGAVAILTYTGSTYGWRF